MTETEMTGFCQFPSATPLEMLNIGQKILIRMIRNASFSLAWKKSSYKTMDFLMTGLLMTILLQLASQLKIMTDLLS